MADRRPRIVISGAAHGVGRLCALSLGGWDLELILCEHDGPALKEVSTALGCLGRFCDVASDASVTILATELQGRFGSMDALINVAGSSYVRPLGTWRMSRALLPALRQSPGAAVIVNVAARARPEARGFPYACSGEGIDGLNEALVTATRGTNVGVEAVNDQTPPTLEHPSFRASKVVAIIATTFGLPPFTAKPRRNSAA